MPSANLSDQSLVRCAQSGDAQAFDRLVLKYRPRIVDLAMRYSLNRIARNCASNLLKARRRDSLKNAIDFTDYQHAVRHPTRLWDLATPEELALTADIHGMAKAALEGLPEEHRTAILLREIDGLSYRQIASAMSIPVGTVRSRVFRARDIIDHQLRRVHDGGLGRRTARRSHPVRESCSMNDSRSMLT